MLIILGPTINPISTFFFLNDPATTEISPLPHHDALPISSWAAMPRGMLVAKERQRMRWDCCSPQWGRVFSPPAAPASSSVGAAASAIGAALGLGLVGA